MPEYDPHLEDATVQFAKNSQWLADHGKNVRELAEKQKQPRSQHMAKLSLRQRLANLISDQLEKHGGLVFVAAKKLILEFGCAHADQAIAMAHDAWNAMCVAIDIPYVPEAAEKKIEEMIWDRIELGLQQFKENVCPTTESAGEKSLLSNAAIVEMANDPTLPMAA